MGAKKILKALKKEVSSQLDAFIGDSICDDVEILCTDKVCLIDSIFEKMDKIIDNGKKTKTSGAIASRNLAGNKTQGA